MTPDSTAPITNRSSYTQPFAAMLNGQPVKVIQSGDREGSSPVLQYVGQDRKLHWESEIKFEVIDTNLLPPSLDSIQAAAGQSGTQRNR